MTWMLIGGGTMFALIVGGVVMAMLKGQKPPAQPTQAPQVGVDSEPTQSEAPAAPNKTKSDAAFLAEAEPLARRFMEAPSVEEMLPTVRNPALAEPRMKLHYPNGKTEALGMATFNSSMEIARAGIFCSLKVMTRRFDEKTLTFVETPQGLKIDWESSVGWSNMPWSEFIKSKPTSPQVFRVVLKDVDYYNFGFTDDRKWQSYLLESPDAEFSLYGYAERGSQLHTSLRLPPDGKKARIMLSMKYPADATSPQQVLIEKVIADSWVTENEESP